MEDDNINCWEFKGCGREPDGKNASRDGVCPVAIETRANRIHQGKNGGRCCWAVIDSYCNVKGVDGIPGNFLTCRSCKFYALVKKSSELLVVA